VAARPAPKLPPIKLPFLEPVFDRLFRKLVINPVNMSRPENIDILGHVTATFDQSAAASLAQRFVRRPGPARRQSG
jgi:hypothetical protein